MPRQPEEYFDRERHANIIRGSPSARCRASRRSRQPTRCGAPKTYEPYLDWALEQGTTTERRLRREAHVGLSRRLRGAAARDRWSRGRCRFPSCSAGCFPTCATCRSRARTRSARRSRCGRPCRRRRGSREGDADGSPATEPTLLVSRDQLPRATADRARRLVGRVLPRPRPRPTEDHLRGARRGAVGRRRRACSHISRSRSRRASSSDDPRLEVQADALSEDWVRPRPRAPRGARDAGGLSARPSPTQRADSRPRWHRGTRAGMGRAVRRHRRALGDLDRAPADVLRRDRAAGRRRACQRLAEGTGRGAARRSVRARSATSTSAAAAPRRSPICARTARIVVMFCAFDGPPRILRLHGTGSVLVEGDERFAELSAGAPSIGPPQSTRSIIHVAVDRIADSCGYGVPLMEVTGERDHYELSAAKRLRTGGPDALVRRRAEINSHSIDGLPALDGLVAPPAADRLSRRSARSERLVDVGAARDDPDLRIPGRPALEHGRGPAASRARRSARPRAAARARASDPPRRRL